MSRQTVAYSRVVHLSHVIAPDMPRWPGDPPLELETIAERAADGFYLRRIGMGEHGATQGTAPLTSPAGGTSIDRSAADRLVAPAIVLDVRASAAADPDYLATPDDLATWERAHGAMPADCIVLLHTGWG